MSDPPWLAIGRKDIGLREVPGVETLPAMRRWLIQAKAWWDDDETPWCGTWVNHCVVDAGFTGPPQAYKARAWLEWGTQLSSPVLGCLAVFDGGPRRPGGGHVGIVVGRDAALNGGNLMILAGNQRDMVCILPFSRARVLPGGYRWAPAYPLGGHILPLVGSDGRVSTFEG